MNKSLTVPSPQAASPSREDLRKGRSMVRNVMSNWIWYFLVMISGFIIPRLIGNHLGKDLLGIWDLGWNIVNYMVFLTIGLNSSVSRYVARQSVLKDWEGLNTSVNTALWLLLAASGIGILVSIVLAFCVRLFLPADTDPHIISIGRQVIFILACCSALQLPGTTLTGVLTGYERYDLLNIVRGVSDMAFLILAAVALWLRQSLVTVALIRLATEVVGDIIRLILTRRLCSQLHFSLRYFSWSASKEMAGFGGKTALQWLSSSTLYQLNSILLARFGGLAVLAVYSRQRALIMHAVRFVKQYAIVFAPASSTLDATGDQAGLRRLLIQTSKYGLFVTLPIMVLLIVMGGPIVDIWMGPGFAAPLVLAVMALGHLLAIPQTSVYMILVGMNRHGRPGLFSTLAAAASLGLAFVFLIFGAKYGDQGAMLAAALAMAVPIAVSDGIATPLYACRLLNLSYSRYWREILIGPIMAALPLAGCLIAARVVFRESPIVAFICGVGVGGVVTLAIYWTWVLPSAIRDKVLAKVGWKAAQEMPLDQAVALESAAMGE